MGLRQQGMALVMVLWGAMLLTLMAASFAFSMRVETTTVGNYLHRAQALALAEAGVRRATLELLAPRGGEGWQANGVFHDMDFGQGRVRITIYPESAKIDLNRAPGELIHGMFNSLVGDLPDFSKDDAKRVSEAFLEWRGTRAPRRSASTRRQRSAAQRRLAQGPQRTFRSVAELNLIPGMQPEIIQAIAQLVTVHSQMAKIDAATASRRVLLAIPGLDHGRVDQFLAARAALNQSDTGVSQVRPRLPMELLEAGVRHLSRSRVSVFTVDSRATVPGDVSVHVRAVVRLTGQARKPYSVLAWTDTPHSDYLQ